MMSDFSNEALNEGTRGVELRVLGFDVQGSQFGVSIQGLGPSV